MISFTTKKNPWLIWALAGGLLVLFVANMFIGSSGLTLSDFFNSFSDPLGGNYAIFFNIRLPRTLACMCVGMALACSGLLLQAMLNNSLASPGIIGINSGAGLAVVLAAAIFPSSLAARSVGAFIGALLTALLIYAIARLSGSSKGTLILAGVAVSRLFSALSDTVVLYNPSALTNRATFSVGSLSGIYLPTLYVALPVVLVGIVAAIILSRNLDILTLGDDTASSLGLNVKLTRFICLTLSALLSSAAVSLAGLLSFLGLIAPHITRQLTGVSDYRRLTVLTVLFGADITLLCDLLARTVFAPYEIPVGVIMAILGVPFFLFLLLSKRRRNRYDAN